MYKCEETTHNIILKITGIDKSKLEEVVEHLQAYTPDIKVTRLRSEDEYREGSFEYVHAKIMREAARPDDGIVRTRMQRNYGDVGLGATYWIEKKDDQETLMIETYDTYGILRKQTKGYLFKIQLINESQFHVIPMIIVNNSPVELAQQRTFFETGDLVREENPRTGVAHYVPMSYTETIESRFSDSEVRSALTKAFDHV